MAKSSTTLQKGDNLPGRGRSQRTIILEAIRNDSLINLTPESTKDDAEVAFVTHTARRAFNPEDPQSAMLLNVLWNKGWGSMKPNMSPVEFSLKDGTDTEKAKSILNAISNGNIPPDTGTMLLGALKDLSVIEANEELKTRIEAIEKSLGIANG